MKLKRMKALGLAMVLTALAVISPVTAVESQAAESTISVSNSSKLVPSFTVTTSKYAVRALSKMTWDELDREMQVVFKVNDSYAGDAAKAVVNAAAASVGAQVYGMIDVGFYKQLGGEGRLIVTEQPIVFTMTAPNLGDYDYGVVSIGADSTPMILGDLDDNPGTITIAANTFLTYAVIYGPKGSLNAYKAVQADYSSPALTAVSMIKTLPTQAGIVNSVPSINAFSVTTPNAAVNAAMGLSAAEHAMGLRAVLRTQDSLCGATAKAAMTQAIQQTAATGYHLIDVQLNKEGAGQIVRVNKTSAGIAVTMTVPKDFPIYADYAVAVLNTDGTVSILPDTDVNPGTITITTADFQLFGVMFGNVGAFNTYK